MAARRKTSTGRKMALLSGVVFGVLLAVFVWVSWEDLRAWYLLWREFDSLGKNAQGYSEFRLRQTGIIFVKLPGGKFWMGAQGRDPRSPNWRHSTGTPARRPALNRSRLARPLS